ncbi:hypothetical protein Tco_1030472 [Tanacetum coccineum]|uniref:Retrotransposon gag domain-containing protein n=1 Tax=Tanacetum coccineum TaxID=301880 RepID=A0ABQ5G6W4_9ASTR
MYSLQWLLANTFRKLFKTTSLDFSNSSEFDLFSDPENQSEEEVTKAMGNMTMEEYMTITRINNESGNEKGRIELKGQFLIELRDNAFSGTNGEDAVEHIENFLEIVDSLNIPNVSNNQLRVRVFTFSLTGAASKWWEDESIGSIVKWDPTNIEFKNWLASKFRNHITIDQSTKNARWDYWRRVDDKEMITDNELSNPRDNDSIEENEIDQIFRIDTDIFRFETPLCQAFKEINYLSQVDVDVGTKDLPGFKTYEDTRTIESMSGMMKYHGDLPGFIREGNLIRYEDYEWYDTINSELKEEALINKRILEESMNAMEESSDDK